MSLEIVHCMNCSLNVAKAADGSCPGCRQIISDQSQGWKHFAHNPAGESAGNKAQNSINIGCFLFASLITGAIYLWAQNYGVQLGAIPLAIISSGSAAFVSMVSTAIKSE